MKTSLPPLPTLLAIGASLGALAWLAWPLWRIADAVSATRPAPVRIAFLVLPGLGLLLAALSRHLRREDRIADLEAALCLEQSARGHADRALAQADLLLARMAASAAGATGPGAQLLAIQSELARIQQLCVADQDTRLRLARLRRRLERLGASLRTGAPAAEPG